MSNDGNNSQQHFYNIYNYNQTYDAYNYATHSSYNNRLHYDEFSSTPMESQLDACYIQQGGYCETNYLDYPSCSRPNCDQENIISAKYCSIQNVNKPACEYQADFNALVTDIFPQLPFEIDNLDQQEDVDIDVVSNCLICGEVYSTQLYSVQETFTLTTHRLLSSKLTELLGKVNKSNAYLCSDCLKLINNIDSLEFQLKKFKADLMEKCASVSKINRRKDKCCKHRVSCKICKKVFTLEIIYKQHLNWHRCRKRYLCEFCGKRFTKANNFKSHLQVHVQRIIKLEAFHCKACRKPFRTKSNLIEHENFCTGKLPYECAHCKKRFTSTTKLKNHTKLKHEKKFISICSICNIGFVKISAYKTHMISHSTDKKFNCDKCDKSYKTLSNLKFHMKFHRDKLPFNCHLCEKGFMRREYLESHINMHKGERNYVCSKCNKGFLSQKNLDVHVKHHDGEVKKKACNVCGKLITKGLEDHLRTHTNLKEFECESCKMRFNTKGALGKHRKRKHCDSEENIKVRLD